MYTNPANLIKTLVNILNNNSQQINQIIRQYQPKQHLTVYEGMRATLPADAYPSFEIEPSPASIEWATTRSQRPRYTFTCTLTVKVSNIQFGVEYITTIATQIGALMTSPENLQMKVVNETRWDPNGGLVDAYILDSLVDNLTYAATKDGTVRTAEFSWFVIMHEPFPESKWVIGDATMPTILKPVVITPA